MFVCERQSSPTIHRAINLVLIDKHKLVAAAAVGQIEDRLRVVEQVVLDQTREAAFERRAFVVGNAGEPHVARFVTPPIRLVAHRKLAAHARQRSLVNFAYRCVRVDISIVYQ
jgi:vacuolar-type H+-ATPase subunit B/Vma2